MDRAQSGALKTVFAFLDYRLFLAYRFREKLRSDRKFSSAKFATQVGFASQAHLASILNGGRNLPPSKVGKLGLALGLKAKEREYFATLVRFNQAGTPRAKRVLYSKLCAMGDLLQDEALIAYQKNALDLAKHAMHGLPKQERHVSTMTVGVSPTAYAAMEMELLAFKERIKSLVQNDTSRSRVFQFTLALFPVSKSP
jgi:Domain of unknown function (DUF4423)